MRDEYLIACQPRPFRATTQADAQAAAQIPDLVTRDFTADCPGIKFVGDVTYIHTWAGFIYLATVIDCYSKKVVGWSIADHMRTELVADALKNAAATTVIKPSAIFHSSALAPPWQRLHIGRLPALDQGPRDAFIDGPHRSLLGQRDGRIVFLSIEKRTRLPDRIRHLGPSQTRCHRLHRGLLQHPPTPFSPWLPVPERSPLRLHPAGHGSIEITQLHCPKTPQQPRGRP